MENFKNFSDNARVWIYTSNRPFEAKEQEEISHSAHNFAKQWASHGTKLTADAAVISPYHLAFVVEGNLNASGCSIDSSVRFVKDLGKKLNVDFFNRLNITALNDQKDIFITPFKDLKNQPELLIFNPQIENLKDLRNNWLIKASTLFPA